MDAIIQNFRSSFGPTTLFFQSLSLDSPTTMEELYRWVGKFSTLEDNIRATSQTIMIIAQNTELDAKGPSEQKRSQGKPEAPRRAFREDERSPPPPPPPSSLLSTLHMTPAPHLRSPRIKVAPANEGRTGPAQQIPTVRLSQGPWPQDQSIPKP